jgi:[ribosomal protein S5]-alanine N-acetyltransferase
MPSGELHGWTMTSIVSIETNRLILRTVTMDDRENVASSWNLDGTVISLEEAGGKVGWLQSNYAQNTPGHLVHLGLAVIQKENQAFIGWCGLDHLDSSKEYPVIFYLLKESCWGKGLATEAASALLRYAFKELGLNRIDGGAAFENSASKRVMEKIGMRCTGLDEEGGSSYTISRKEYFKCGQP